jgi:hypothetical protein
MAEENKQKKIAALLRKSETTEQTAVQVVSNDNLSSNKIVNLSSDKISETKSEVGTDELATRVSGIESLIPKLDVKIGKVSKKVDNLKSATNRKFERITKEIDIIAEGLDGNNSKVTKLSKLIDKQKGNNKDNKDLKNIEKGNNKIISVLSSMLEFMQRVYEEDKLGREQQNNFSEEQKAEKERRDKALLEAMKSKKGTAEKIKKVENGEDDGGIFGKLLGAFTSILSGIKSFMSMIGNLFSVMSKIFGSIGKFILNAGRLLFTVGRFFLMTPLGAALLLGVAATVALFTLLANDKNPEETSKGIINAGAADGGMAQSITDVTEATDENAISSKKNNLLANRPREKKSYVPWKDPDLQKAYLKEIGWDEKTGTTKVERDAGAIKIDADGKLVYKVEEPKAVAPGTPSTTEEGMKNYKSRAPSSQTETPNASTEAAMPTYNPPTPNASTEPANVTNEQTPPPAPASSATPMSDTSNLGTQMATMSTENALTKTVEELAIASSSQVNNVMAATKRIVEHTIDKVPSVRNQEETFQRMIFNSTRVV